MSDSPSELENFSAAVKTLLTKVSADNKRRKFQRRESIEQALKLEGPRIVTLYRHDNSHVFGICLRGAKDLDDTGSFRGQYIRAVDLESPADQAGLKAGDRILAVDGQPVEAAPHDEVRALIAKGGTTLKLLVVYDPKLGAHAKSVTKSLIRHTSEKVVDKRSGLPMLTAEMKQHRLGRTRTLQQNFHPTSPTFSELSFNFAEEDPVSLSKNQPFNGSFIGTESSIPEHVATSSPIKNKSPTTTTPVCWLVTQDHQPANEDKNSENEDQQVIELTAQAGDTVIPLPASSCPATIPEGFTYVEMPVEEKEDDSDEIVQISIFGFLPSNKLEKFGFDTSF